MDEFSVIKKYFAPLTMGRSGTEGLQDDGAVLSIPGGYELAVTSDSLNEGVHFMIGETPDVVARKALRVNLSDLASMGAKPLCYQLNIAFPNPPEETWLKAFSGALLDENKRYGIYCSGGDTTSIKSDYISISVTAFGYVPRGKAVRRSGAKKGDAIVITGPIGDAALGLKMLLAGEEGGDPAYKSAIKRSSLPEPRVGIEGILHKYANGATDISDGLVADCLHIARASGLGIEIDMKALKFSEAVQTAIRNGDFSLEEAVCGGDDYELVIAVSEGKTYRLLDELEKSNLKPLVIGKFADNGLKTDLIGNEEYLIDDLFKGWKHF